MATNKILPWAQTGTANVLSDDAYAADVATGGLYGDGVKTGQASSQQANKTWRQATAPGSGLGQFLVDNLSVDVTDADTPATFSSRIANAILKLAQISPFNQSWAVATGGYRKYAIVSDSSGNYWVSTTDQNTTVPGASGANWQSLFNGYATQAWANGQFLQLADTETQTVTGPVAFTGETEVPDTSDFAGKDALNAKTAEGRYITSVPTTGQTRITGLVENSDGRAVFEDGTNSPVLANLADLPMDDPTLKLQAFYATPYYNFAHNNPARVSFPRAFKPGTIPVVMIPNTQEMGTHRYWISNVIAGNNINGSTTELLVDNEGFSVGGYVIGSGIEGEAGSNMIIPVYAVGVYA